MDKRYDDLGRLILRIGIAGLLLIHGLTKLQNGIGVALGAGHLG